MARTALSLAFAVPISLLGCAHSETVVHLSAPHETSWEVRDAAGARLCSLPCTVELDEHDAVRVERADGRTQFVLHQENLGEGTFSGSVRVQREPTRGAVAAKIVSAAFTSAGAALAESRDREDVTAGALLTGIGAAAAAAGDAAERTREELWVERTSAP